MRCPGVDLVLSDDHAAVSKEDVPELSLLMYSRKVSRFEMYKIHGGWADFTISINASSCIIREQDTDRGPPWRPRPNVLLTLLPPPSHPIRY